MNAMNEIGFLFEDLAKKYYARAAQDFYLNH